MRKRIFKKIIASFLATMLCLSSTGISVLANENTTIKNNIAKEIANPSSDDVATGYIDSGIKFGKVNSEVSLDKFGIDKSETLPTSYDSRTKEYVTSVKNQNPWGTCWAFSAVAAMESYALSHGLVDSPEDINLSEFALAYLTFEDENMLKESTGDYTDIKNIDIGFNAGGNDEMAFKALSNGLAVYNDDEIQYTEAQNKGIVPKINWDENNISYVFTGQKFINMEEMDQVKAAIIENGAVAASYYSSTQYSNQNYTYNYNYEKPNTNHAIAIIGWDNNKDKNLFTITDGTNTYTPSKNGAWLIKNSWGTYFGEDGYMWISYEDMGILSNDAVIYEIELKENYPNLYQHDGATIAYYFTDGEEFANVYEVKGDNQIINAISFFVYDTNKNYTVYLYDNSDGSLLDEGSLITSKSGTITYGGYYTVDLDNNYVFTEGDKFSVVVAFDTSTYFLYATPIQSLTEEGNTYSIAKEGQSYIKFRNQSEFNDVATLSDCQNITIKAFSKSANEFEATTRITDIAFTDKNQITINWKKVEGATSYEIWRGLNETEGQVIASNITDTTYIDSTITHGETYYYKVRPIFENDIQGAYSQIKDIDIIPNITNVNINIENKKFIIKWSENSFVDGCDIFVGDTTDVQYIDTINNNTTTYMYDKELNPGKYYYFAVKPYILDDNNEIIYGDYDILKKQASAGTISVKNIKQTIEGSVTIEWDIIEEGFINGYLIYVSRGNDMDMYEISKEKTSFTIDVSKYNAGNIVRIELYPYMNTDNGHVRLEDGFIDYLMLKEVFNENVYWDIKNNQINLYMPETEAENYEVYYNYDKENGYFLDSIEVNAYEMEIGFALPIKTTETYIGIACEETDTVVPKELFKVGENFIEPSLEVIPNNRVLKDTGFVLKANILNKMKNFHYGYQWYVSDTKDGEATAIEGATYDEYTVILDEQDAKYYYCIITCEYNNTISYQTTNATGERTKIVGKANIDDIIIEDITDQYYTNTEITPSLTIKDNETILIQDIHYTVTYENNIDVGEAIVKIVFMGEYSSIGTLIKRFNIITSDISIFEISNISNCMYTGSEIIPDFIVKKGFTTLEEGIDYTVSISNNINVGKATVTITGIGNYTGALSKNFNITPALASYITIENITAKNYTGSAHTPDVIVKYKDIILEKDTDYSISFNNNINVGTGTVNIVFKGNYEGTLAKKFTINPKPVADFSISSISNQIYTGSYITPKVLIKDGDKTLTLGTDYVTTYSNNVNAGNGKVTITGKGNYVGSLDISFIIIAKSIDGIIINNIADQTYTGSAIKPSITVKDSSYTLVNNKDYTVSYANNINSGTATVTITGKGNYSGTKTISFKINTVPSKATSSSLTISNTLNLISKITAGTKVNSIVSSINEGKHIAIYNNLVKLNGDALVGTGMKLCIMNDNKIYKEYKLIVTGDTNGDGKINITDMIGVKAKILKKQNLSNESEKAADVNGDGKVNITDFIKIKASLLGKDKISGVSIQ